MKTIRSISTTHNSVLSHPVVGRTFVPRGFTAMGARRWGALALALGCLASPSHAQMGAWTVTNLNPAGATHSEAVGVFNTQQVGFATIGGVVHASVWSGTAASWVDLSPAGATTSHANGISGTRQVGSATIGGVQHAGLWNGTAASWVDLHPTSADSSEALAASSTQQVGESVIGDAFHAGLWSGTAASWVDLHPAVALYSSGWGAFGTQQVGAAHVGGVDHASLWNGTAASWVDLNPDGIPYSFAFGTAGTQQVGFVSLGTSHHASLWSGTADSWVDLSPAGAEDSVAVGAFGTQQVGDALVGGKRRAILWSGTADSWEDLSLALPGSWSDSYAKSIWADCSNTYVAGYGYDATGEYQALLWSRPIPHPSCTGAWHNEFPGLVQLVRCMTVWDPDGAGPLAPVLVVGGDANLTGVGEPVANNIMYWDTTTSSWAPLGSGMTSNGSFGGVRALTVYNGDLIAGGNFTAAGGAAANDIARWSGPIAGGSWQPMASGIAPVGGGVNTMAVYGANLVVAGNFFTAGGIAGVGQIALWDGAAWHAMNSGFNSSVSAVASYNGRAYASGGFSAAAGGNFLNGIGSWGSPVGPWVSPGSGLTFLGSAMAVYNNELIVGGAGGVNNIARWNGSIWGTLGAGNTAAGVNALTVWDDGLCPGSKLVVAGDFITAGGIAANRIAKWDGTTWGTFGGGMDSSVKALVVYNGELVAAGSFTHADGAAVSRIAAYSSCCRADFDGSGALSVNDIFAFLSAWFAADPRANFNGVNGTNVQDIFDFLSAWFAGCP